MVLDKISRLISDKEPNPNKFTVGMGELIRKAREDKGLSQDELAQLIYRRRATVSDIETGKVEVSAGTLILLAAALDKPISYFFPRFIYKELQPAELTPLEQELLLNFRKIWDEHIQRIAVDQVQVLSNFDPRLLGSDLLDFIKNQREQEEEIGKIGDRGQR